MATIIEDTYTENAKLDINAYKKEQFRSMITQVVCASPELMKNRTALEVAHGIWDAVEEEFEGELNEK